MRDSTNLLWALLLPRSALLLKDQVAAIVYDMGWADEVSPSMLKSVLEASKPFALSETAFLNG